MSQYVTLLGAEEVSRAASQMSAAATDMSRAASHFQSVFEGHQCFMDDWLSRLDAMLAERVKPIAKAEPLANPPVNAKPFDPSNPWNCEHGLDNFDCPECRPF